MTQIKNILVTGANAGIGNALSHLILKNHPKTSLIFTYRNVEKGKEALKELKQQFPQSNILDHQLDVSDSDSIAKFAPWLRKSLPDGLDVLINNAGVASKGSAITREIAEGTFAVNYFGLKNLTKALYDQIVDNGRVVNVSSGMGQATGMDPKLKQRFLDANITEEQLDALVEKFLDDIDKDQLEKEGWVKNSYAVSKLAVNMWTRLRAREDKRIVYTAVCPNWCATNMGGQQATHTAEHGAESVLASVYGDAKEFNGGFFREGKPLDW